MEDVSLSPGINIVACCFYVVVNERDLRLIILCLIVMRRAVNDWF
jgi:hypothetical protein